MGRSSDSEGLRLWRVPLIDFKMRKGGRVGEEDGGMRSGCPKGWSCHMTLQIISQRVGDEQIPGISQECLSMYTHTWAEYVREAHNPRLAGTFNKFDLWRDDFAALWGSKVECTYFTFVAVSLLMLCFVTFATR